VIGNGIVWAVENSSSGAAVLYAFDATDLSRELYNSNQAGVRDHFGADNKFITPAIVNGKVYVGTPNGVGVFGLLSQGNPTVFEPETLAATTSGQANQNFSWAGFTDGIGTTLAATAPGEYVTYTANVTAAGTYDVRIAVMRYLNFGTWQLSIDGSNQGLVQDEYAAQPAWSEFDLGAVTITSTGPRAFKFTVVGKNAQSTGYRIAFDYIKLIPQ
jgi:hypothetical protein